jgi:FkbM family methyltransferase
LLEKALSLHRAGQLAEAASLYRKIIAQEPKNADALHLLGVIEAQKDNSLAAIALIDRAIELTPNNAGFYSDRGVVLQKLKRFDDALASYDQALAIKPAFPEALNNRGLALHDLKRFEDALSSYDRALAIKPNYAEALYNRGRSLQELKRFADALASYDQALAIRSNYADALNNRGLVLQELKRFAEGLASYARALTIRPDDAGVLNNRGLALQDLKRHEQALASYDRALAIRPDYPEALNNRARALHALNRFEEALAGYNHALAIRPDYPEALNHRGVAFHDLKRLEEALASYDHALASKPDYIEALNNRGLALQELKRLEDALASYDRALAIKPDYADALHNRGIARLLAGRLEEGFRDYEWRWKTSGFLSKAPLKAKEWQGEDIDGRSILIFAEQGRGDVIQFARYLPLLVQRGADVSFLGPPEIIRLLGSLDPQVKLIGSLNVGHTFDFQCALISLPLRFGTELLSIPNDVPYLKAEGDLVTRWKARLGHHGFKVGIAWQGSPEPKVDNGRSIPLAAFARLSRLSGIRLISLQKKDGLDQLARLPPGAAIEILGDGFDDGPDAFIDTAAVMENLDLIITSDTSIAHLAGALARPTWVALKYLPDWRWLLDREDSPWYPTMRLFRQETAGDWQSIFSTIEQELRSLLGSQNATPTLGNLPRAAKTSIQSSRRLEHPETNPGDRRPLLDTANLRIKRCKHGLMMFHAKDACIGRSLDRYGEFSERETELFDRILRPGMTVVDVGADIGTHTIYFAKTVGPSGEVFAFEPQRVLYQMLCGNIALNRYSNVVAANVALGSQLGTALVPEIDYAKNGNFGEISVEESKSSEELAVKTLDSYGLKSCHLIKINIEGEEWAVLEGAKTLLKQQQSLLYVENYRADKSKDLIQWLFAKGYRLYWHRPPMFNSHNHFGEAENIFGNSVSVNIFCMPRPQSVDVTDLTEVTS